MVALALDLGDVRTGIAVSDLTGRVASPVSVLPSQEVDSLSRSFRQIVDDYMPDVLVCGMPLTMAGEAGPQAEHIRKRAEELASKLDLPLYFMDERLSSTEAKRILRNQGLNEKQMRGKVDMISASIFLQAWLDTHERKDERDIESK